MDDVDATQLLERLAGDLADAAELAVAVGVLLAVLDDLTADHGGALTNHYHRIVAGILALVSDNELGQALDVEGYLTDQGTVDVGEVGGDQRGLATVAAE